MKLPVVMVHRVDDAGYFKSMGIQLSGEECSMQRFLAVIGHLKSNYEVLPLMHVIKAMREKKALPKNAAVLTFDDGTRDHLEVVLPILKDYKISATFFVMSMPLTGKIPATFKMQMVTGGAVPFDEIADRHFPAALEKHAPEFLEIYRAYREGREVVPEARFIGEPAESVRQMKYVLRYLVKPAHLQDLVADELFMSLFGNEREYARKIFLQPYDARKLVVAGMEIGSHADSHINFATIDPRHMYREVVASQAIIASSCGSFPDIFAFTGGDWGPNTPELRSMVEEHYAGACIIGDQKQFCDTQAGPYDVLRIHEKYIV